MSGPTSLPRPFILRFAVALLVFSSVAGGLAAATDLSGEPLVDVAKICPGIVIELRYATDRNFTGRALYPRGTRCLVRESVATRLSHAQAALAKGGYGLKIWDAYRPHWAQLRLWKAAPNPEFVGDPAKGGSLHSWGVAVDATLVDRAGREQRMPTDFDDFTPAAAQRYRGRDRLAAANLRRLQKVMARAGFCMMRDEWWHFVARDCASFRRVDLPANPKRLPHPK